MRSATTRSQHLSVAPAKVATALPQWTTTKPRKLQPAHRCPRNRKLLRTALNSTQQSLPRYIVGASLAHLLRATTSTPTSRPCLGTHLQLTPQQITRSRTDLSEMHPSLNASFNSLDRLRAITPDALLTETLAPKSETASLDHVVDPVHVKISCHQVHTRRLVWSQRSHSPSTVHAHPAVITLTFTNNNNQAVRSTGRTSTLAPLPCWSAQCLFLLVVVVSGHPQPSWRTRHPCTVDALPGPTGVIWSPGWTKAPTLLLCGWVSCRVF